MAFCPSCGTDMGPAAYCPRCGTSSQLYSSGTQYYSDGSQPYGTGPQAYGSSFYGQPPQQPPPQYSYQNEWGYPRPRESQTLFTVAFAFMIVSIIILVISGFAIPLYFICLAWCIPMTVHCSHIRQGRKPNTVAFGVCCLLFCGIISGILLLVAPKDYDR